MTAAAAVVAAAALDRGFAEPPARIHPVALFGRLVSPVDREWSRPTRVGELARRPSSPNSGWPMATLAVLLQTRLEKPGHYLLDGGPEAPDAATAARGVRLVSRAGLLAFAVAGVVAWF
ncbi:Cobalamin biosynthesis protein CbiB [Haloferax massiliensis]|uniref:Probable cobalamin biosynthesis protein CobD n=1 Tax=Haloferax massiliensis TaxID=1476858 RepID=A0A0D6JSU5_9EURY|nr:Cobalamin biosynthesis protein CbiB [Haloferax massiliensis]